jgi:hypothetical protein
LSSPWRIAPAARPQDVCAVGHTTIFTEVIRPVAHALGHIDLCASKRPLYIRQRNRDRTRAIDLTEALLLPSHADQRSFAPEHVDLSLAAEEAIETLLSLADRNGVTIQTSGDMALTTGSHALLLQMATNLVPNAIVHNLPGQGNVWVTTSVHLKTVLLSVENTGEDLAPELVSTLCRAVSAQHQTHTHRRRRPWPWPWPWPWPGNRQKHHPGARRNPHPCPAPRWRTPRHGATTRRATADWQMTIKGIATPED